MQSCNSLYSLTIPKIQEKIKEFSSGDTLRFGRAKGFCGIKINFLAFAKTRNIGFSEDISHPFKSPQNGYYLFFQPKPKRKFKSSIEVSTDLTPTRMLLTEKKLSCF